MSSATLLDGSFAESGQFSSLIIDRGAGVIRNIKILGPVSKNGRKYAQDAMRNACTLYENAVVNKNHDRVNQNDRDVDDRLGRIVNAHYIEGEGIYGDFELLMSHPMADRIMEAAEKMPNTMGFSHFADCAYRKVKGVEEVVEIRKVYSVDLVANPATTSSLSESVNEAHKANCERCTKMEGVAKCKDTKYADKLKAIAEEYGMKSDADGDSDGSSDSGDSGEKKGSSPAKESFVDPVTLKEAVMADPVEPVVLVPVTAPAVSAPITESVVVAPVGTSLSEVQDLCAAAGITLESALLESLSKLPKAEVIPVIRRVALAESVSKPLTSVPIAVAGKVPDKDVFSWLKS